MPLRRFVIEVFAVGLTLFSAGTLWGQNYPDKPIRLVTVALGGSADFAARLLAQGISGSLGQSVIVDNRGSIKSGEVVATAPPDGYTLLLSSGGLWTGALLQKTPYDPVRDLLPVTLVSREPNVLVVNSALPVKSVKELIAYARSKPGELNYASSTTGTSTHLAAELFNSLAGVKLVRVPYKGIGAALGDLLAGQVQLAFPAAGAITSQLKSGRLRALAVTTLERSALLPELPTIAEAGVPGYESVVAYGLFAPAKTPDAIIDRLYRETSRFLKTAEAREKFLHTGAEVVAATPAELAAFRKSDMARMSKVIKDAGIRVE